MDIPCGKVMRDNVEIMRNVKIPVTIICGEKAGKTVLVSAGVHCREFVGIEASVRLAGILKPEDLTGQVMIIHACNITGYNVNYPDLVPEDGKNLNRVFPGDPNGSFTERLAAALEEKFLTAADYHIDLHCGGAWEDLYPHVYRQGKASKEVLDCSGRMCNYVQVEYYGSAEKDTGGFYNRAGALGIPGILIERGGRSLYTEEEVGLAVKDICNVLRFLNVLSDDRVAVKYHPVECKTLSFAYAESGSLWYPAKKPGQIVKRGECLGSIRDFTGKVIQNIFSNSDGVLLYQRSALSVQQGDFLTTVGETAV
jgi:hypothetical protein